jgi:hypothetical protein
MSHGRERRPLFYLVLLPPAVLTDIEIAHPADPLVGLFSTGGIEEPEFRSSTVSSIPEMLSRRQMAIARQLTFFLRSNRPPGLCKTTPTPEGQNASWTLAFARKRRH